MEEKVKKSTQNAFSAMGKWFYAFIATAVLLVGAVVAIIVIALGAKNADEPPTFSEGSETGIYYYDAALGEYTLTLNSGNRFTIAGPDLNKSGEYTVAEGTVTLDFVRDEDGTAQATLNGDALTLVYKDATMNFLKKIPYTVTFSTNGGSEVGAVTVINGKTVGKPNDPAKAGNVFLGWYADEALTEAFFFGTTPVLGDTTVYAKWAATVPGQDEFVIDFDLGYNADAPAAMSTVGGKLVFDAEYAAPTREGYTFVGWFVSAYEDGSKLTYAATENMTLDANTTLFAVWSDNSANKLQTPAVSVVGNTISWAAVEGANAYVVTITDDEGNVLFDQSVGTTTQNYDFASAPAGDYEVTVVAKGSGAADSDAAVRCYQNKGLGRVSKFEVIGTTLVFNSVANAEKYLITIDCGNDQHNHTLFDNSNSTNFNFANCTMQPGGISFTVTAVAEGYASTVSETYYYVRNLDKVGDIVYDAASATFKWNSVANAGKYYVVVECAGHTHAIVDNGNATSYCVKECTGDVTIRVIPASNGFNSPEATSAKINKVTPATPSNIVINGLTVTWDAAEGATSYVIKVDGTSYNVTGTSYNLQDTGLTFTTGSKHTISVQAIGATDKSVESDTIEASYLTMGKVSYNNNTVSWTPVMGATKFDVRVNGGESFSVTDATSAKVTLTKAGVNKIEVRPSGFASNTEWTAIEVFAYQVVYETRSLNGSVTEYVAKGDAMSLPTTFEYSGFEFDGWYNTPGAAEGNGAEYTETVFTGTGSMTLYANWAPKSYKIEFVGIDGAAMSGAATGDTVNVTYTKGYALPVMTTTDTVKSNFAGWYTGPDGTGIKLTDYLGKSVSPYGITDNSVAYPYFTSGLIFELKNDGTYAVKKGSDINTIPVVTIPAEYNGIAVTTILENGFYNCDYLTEINIPDTIQLIGTGAFSSCDAMKSFNVYEVKTETPHEVFYHSHEGALLYDDAASGYTYLEVFPRAKKGAYTIPETVDMVRSRAFNYCNISSLTISKDVMMIGDYGFSNCRSLKQIVFEEGGTSPMSVATNAFYGCYSVTYIKLPALIKGYGEDEEFSTATLDYLTALDEKKP
ncbi:MAG: InlB B-repeat-containing protein, partial [Clostridia bacterium]|nr:InlB B-repeat-containing protein [Clostridia bacterium]